MAFITKKVRKKRRKIYIYDNYYRILNERQLYKIISGPKRYDFDKEHKKWFYHRDNHTLDELLNEELSVVFGQPVDVLEGFDI